MGNCVHFCVYIPCIDSPSCRVRDTVGDSGLCCRVHVRDVFRTLINSLVLLSVYIGALGLSTPCLLTYFQIMSELRSCVKVEVAVLGSSP